ncbi:MAG: alpha/beta hydrolase [Mongoliibacter sp.]|uniref:alpha/beta hydrolase n=1 Tax=Mongoliibacter sp. TaxID=2022438 RepID=UPI0012F41CAC|nr:alpha/beta hydrolase-fold protein [Mongoliibacter sp.]TVP44877.1 MAG: alpha/beta hydrolase [Mongoliibacter sp.]
MMKIYTTNIKNIAFLILISAVSSYKLLAQTNSSPTINKQQSHVLKSTINGHTYNLNISLPQNYSINDTTHYPIFLILDGNFSFPIAHASRTIMDMFGELENIIIVGIGYEWEESFIPWQTDRWTDFTPTKDSITDENPVFRETFELPSGSLVSGGAATFFDVIKNEIIPFVDKEYKTTTDRGISGHSMGGLFVSYCLLSNPGFFSKYGINSPSLWWDNKVMFDIEKSYSENQTELSAKVFMSVGGLEAKSMVLAINEFTDTLRSKNYNGLHLTTHVFENETHTSVIAAMINRTLKILYSPEK